MNKDIQVCGILCLFICLMTKSIKITDSSHFLVIFIFYFFYLRDFTKMMFNNWQQFNQTKRSQMSKLPATCTAAAGPCNDSVHSFSGRGGDAAGW